MLLRTVLKEKCQVTYVFSPIHDFFIQKRKKLKKIKKFERLIALFFRDFIMVFTAILDKKNRNKNLIFYRGSKKKLV
jgi:hypothetical protein